MKTYLLFFVIIFNIAMWIYFLCKKSNKKEIQETREAYEALIKDFNNTTERNIMLLNDRISKLKALVQEADKKISLISELDSKNEALNLLHQQINYSSSYQKQNEVINDSFKLSSYADNQKHLNPEVTMENAVKAYKNSSVPHVQIAKNPIKAKKSLKSQIVELYDLGYSIEEIADQLKSTEPEVQLTLSLENRL